MPRLISVNVGLPRDIRWRGKTVHTGIWKNPVHGRCLVRRLNIDGDGQGDLAGHGGEHRTVMVYQMESYRHWERHLGRNNFVFGQFGENFTVTGLPDNEVCVGDRYRIGSALFEVTQPRVTCYRVGIRMDEPQMAALLVSNHRPGFYFRVLEEGDVGAGDEIIKMADGPERLTIAEIDALLYLPQHPRDQLERALRIPALSTGWKSSLQALLDQKSDALGTGNAGLTGSAGPPPAWQGFRSLRVARVDRESASVVSLSFEAADRSPLPAALPGQFLVLKLRPTRDTPPILRNYSLSGRPGAFKYRVSVKQEVNGVASTFVHNHIHAGDMLEVSAPRGSFTLRPGDTPVVLLSAGIGATPVLAMLHALVSAAPSAPREVWWLYGTRNRDEHPFAQESRGLLKALTHSRTYIAYSRPQPDDRLGEDYDAEGHLSLSVMEQLGVPRHAEFYLCGPASFLSDFTMALRGWGVPANQVHTEIFGPEPSVTPGIAGALKRAPHQPAETAGPGPLVSFTRSGLSVPWGPGFQSLLELAEACDVPVKWSCRTGVCHTCESALISGAVEYQPDPLEQPAEGNALICCSRPRSDVEIDL
ncbi:MAG: MOSC domain-containing protein [Acidobacteriaceae bacterium]|nr:MOSC domain-containing protein [Acidobacteriaceae bacterium]